MGKRSNRRSCKRSNRRSCKRSNRRSCKWTLKKARMVTKKRYKKLLTKKSSRVSLNKNEKKDLDRALFVNYCKCTKKLKKNENIEKGAEYPICTTSVYLKRGIKTPKGVQKKCKRYH